MNLLLLAILVSIPSFVPELSIDEKPEIFPPLEISLSITSVENSVRLSNITMSEFGFFYVIISDKQLESNEGDIINKINENKERVLSSFIDQENSSENLIFTNLNYNQTYFVYYFGVCFMRPEKSQVKLTIIKTPEKHLFTHHFVSGNVDQACTAIITILFIFSLFLFFKKLEEERIFELSQEERSDFYYTTTTKEDTPFPKQEVNIIFKALLS